VGDTVSWNDTGLPAQRRGWLHNVGWWNSVGFWFPGGVRGPTWWGFAFDPSARDVPEHLMLWSGSRCGVVGLGRPRARRRFARGGVRPLSEAEAPWRSAWSSSEAEIRPTGTAASRLVGRCGFLGREPFFASGRDHAERVLWFVGLFV
jgi:hypothetical protein